MMLSALIMLRNPYVSMLRTYPACAYVSITSSPHLLGYRKFERPILSVLGHPFRMRTLLVLVGTLVVLLLS